MDTAEFDRIVEGMEWEEVCCILVDVIADLFKDTGHTTLISPPTPPPTPTPPPPPPVPAGQGFNGYLKPVESLIGGYSEHDLLVAPLSFEQPSPLMVSPGLNVNQHAPIIYQGQPLYNHNIMHSQGQYLPYQFPGHDVPVAAAPVYCPDAPAHQNNNVPVVMLQESQSVCPVSMLNREPVNLVEDSGVTPSDSYKKRECENQQDDDRPYIKKPPNAFMLYMKEQRQNVAVELKLKGSAAVNTILGQRWKSLSEEEQAKYFDQANKERRSHAQRHPDWSSINNYGKKRKRQKSKAPIKTEASAFNPENVTHQAKKLCVTPVQIVEIQPFPLQTHLIEASLTQTVQVELPNSQAA